MPIPQVCVLRAPGTNCDIETAYAFEKSGAKAERLHVFRLLEQPQLLKNAQILCIPGGFSYGDDVGAGVIFASQVPRAFRGSVGGVSAGRANWSWESATAFQVLPQGGCSPRWKHGMASEPIPPASRHAHLERQRQIHRALGASARQGEPQRLLARDRRAGLADGAR